MNFIRSESGTAMIEVAFFLPIMVLLLMGIVNYGMEIEQAMHVQEAASAGAAYGTIPGNQKDTVGMQAAATNAASDVSGLAATATPIYRCTPGGANIPSSNICPGYGTPIMYVQVVVSATVTPMVPWPGMPANQTLNATATYRVPWTP